MATRSCSRCGNTFESRYSHQEYDNPECRRKAETERRAALIQLGREAEESTMTYPLSTATDPNHVYLVAREHGHKYAIRAAKLAGMRQHRDAQRAEVLDHKAFDEGREAIGLDTAIRREADFDAAKAMLDRGGVPYPAPYGTSATGKRAEYEARLAELRREFGLGN